eukprot:scaffold48666_cov17-Tisochrysis_lutea.AAC.1
MSDTQRSRICGFRMAGWVYILPNAQAKTKEGHSSMPKGSTADNSAGWAAALGTNQECTPLQPSYVPSDARGLQALGDLPAQLAVKHREVVPVFDEYGEPHPMHGTYDVHFQRGPVTIPSTTERLQPGAVITPSRESLQPQTTCNSPPSLQLGRDAQAHPR